MAIHRTALRGHNITPRGHLEYRTSWPFTALHLVTIHSTAPRDHSIAPRGHSQHRTSWPFTALHLVAIHSTAPRGHSIAPRGHSQHCTSWPFTALHLVAIHNTAPRVNADSLAESVQPRMNSHAPTSAPVKNSKHWQQYHCLDTRKRCSHW